MVSILNVYFQYVIHQLTQAESVVKACYERNLVEALLTRKITDADFGRMNLERNSSKR